MFGDVVWPFQLDKLDNPKYTADVYAGYAAGYCGEALPSGLPPGGGFAFGWRHGVGERVREQRIVMRHNDAVRAECMDREGMLLAMQGED